MHARTKRISPLGPMPKPTALLAPVALSLAFAASARAESLPPDPLHSPMWAFHARRLLVGAPVVFDPAVRLIVPMIAENQHVFPITVDARTIADVRRILIYADLNPITQAIDYRPEHALAYVSARIKLDQRTPVRAAVLAGDGKWHVGGVWVDAAGGGCSAPPASRVKGDWAQHLGEMRGAAWREGDHLRLRITVRHPMDTGLVENIPAFNLESMVVRGANGAVLASMTIQGSVAEDPAFTLMPLTQGAVSVRLRDTEAHEFTGKVTPGG